MAEQYPKAQITLQLAEDGYVELDYKKVKSIIRELVGNALKFFPPLARGMIDGRIEKQMMVLTITDQGVGTPEAELGQLFESFYRASTAGTVRGIGFGLTIVKTVVEAMKEVLTIHSDGVDKGTTAIVRLPLT